MRYADVEAHCLSLPGVTREFPFGESPVFKVGGKMFALLSMRDGKPSGIWFKAGEASARILTQIDGIRPCPYLARAHWVAMDRITALKASELREYLRRAHALVAQGLSKKKRAALGIADMRDEIFDPFS
jgi:predicted DNA-binding protein (MmcQ/YjbR family)